MLSLSFFLLLNHSSKMLFCEERNGPASLRLSNDSYISIGLILLGNSFFFSLFVKSIIFYSILSCLETKVEILG